MDSETPQTLGARDGHHSGGGGKIADGWAGGGRAAFKWFRGCRGIVLSPYYPYDCWLVAQCGAVPGPAIARVLMPNPAYRLRVRTC